MKKANVEGSGILTEALLLPVKETKRLHPWRYTAFNKAKRKVLAESIKIKKE
jgi:hypothetical protein